MSALESMRSTELADKAKAITARELRTYMRRTVASQAATSERRR
jgi:hypothetical protein